MSADITLPAGAPEEVVTNALVRDIDLTAFGGKGTMALITLCLLYTSPSPRDRTRSRMPSSA